jgi:hypothetical protein
LGLFNPERAADKDIIQTISTVLAADTTTTSTSYVDLISLSITTVGGTSLEVYASFSCSNAVDNAAAGQDGFAVVVDGTVLLQTGNEQWTVTEGGAIFVKTGMLTAGSHSVALQWKTQAGGTLRCSASSLTRPEHASLVVLETSG